jgi:hypothetical protein
MLSSLVLEFIFIILAVNGALNNKILSNKQ